MGHGGRGEGESKAVVQGARGRGEGDKGCTHKVLGEFVHQGNNHALGLGLEFDREAATLIEAPTSGDEPGV